MSGSAFYLLLVGKFLLVFYFLSAGVKNALHFQQRAGLLRARNFPLPTLSLAVGIFCQIFGSLAILFNYFAAIGALLLIIFTLVTNFVICNYWQKENMERYLTSAIFYANFSVIGGLIVVLVSALRF